MRRRKATVAEKRRAIANNDSPDGVRAASTEIRARHDLPPVPESPVIAAWRAELDAKGKTSGKASKAVRKRPSAPAHVESVRAAVDPPSPECFRMTKRELLAMLDRADAREAAARELERRNARRIAKGKRPIAIPA
jgi:hypothetical protein